MKNINGPLKTKQKPWLFTMMLCCCVVFSSNVSFVFATADNVNLSVTTSITSKCVFKSSTGPYNGNISFGTYSPINEHETSPSLSTGGYDAKCTKSTTSQIGLDSGLYASNATTTTRAMSDGQGNYINYEIYSDAGRSTVWSDSNTVEFTDQGGNSTNLPIYASIPPGQDVPAGEYNDTVTMTISY